MKRKLLSFIIFLCTFFVQQNLKAQTTVLAPGDLAFIGYQAGTATDGFSFITLKDINAGTLVYFTDDGWGNGAWITSNPETHLLWTVPAFTPAGKIISIVETSADTFTVTGSSGVSLALGTGFNLASGDQILAYQATAPESASPTFIAGIHADYNSSTYDPVTTWNNAASANLFGGSESSLPPGLTNGVNCISLFPGVAEQANSKYIGTLTGTVAELLAKINNPSATYWSHSNGAADLGITPVGYPTPAVSTVVVATVTTTTATNVKAVSATMGGSLSADGGDPSVQKGIVWATTAAPTIGDHKVQYGTGTGSFSATVIGLPSGTTIYYRAYATNGAGTSYGAELTFTTGAGLSTSATPQVNVACNGGATGSASVTATGGTPSYTYSWSPSGGTAATASNLTAGNYTVTITDGEGTQITRPFTITQPPVLNGTSSTTAVTCFGGNNGTATITPTGGAGTYTYLWSNGATTATATGLAPGTYNVTITDGNACTKNIPGISVGGPTAALTATASTTPVSCFNGSNGTATVTPLGGTGTKTYLWSNGATTATATGLAAGTYSVTVRDANLCSTSVTGIVVGGPTAAVSGTFVTTPVSCFGGNNGSATVTPLGGVGGYTYSWSPSGGSAATASNLTAGTYSVTITDNNGCPATITGITVGGPTAGLTAIASTTAVSCFGASNGVATISVSGGTPNYTYVWSNGATGATATGLATGVYSVLVTDSNSCSRTFNNISVGSVTVINPNPTQVNVSCNGGNNGSATVTPVGGSGTYTYLWNNGATTATISSLTQGNYSVTITDSFSCSVTQAFTITEPPALVASQAALINPSCHNGANGSATVAVTGGTLPYNYSWSPSGGTGITASGLSGGIYTVTVTDAKGCIATQEFTLVQPPALAVTTSQTDILCNGAATGSATVNVTGGTGTYTYSWSPSGGTAATATGLTAGIYTVTIKDANLCQTTQSFTLTQPSALVATPNSQTNIGCRGEATGSATVNATGGTGTYTYSWAPSGGTSATATGLAAGTYTVTIKDANLCQTTQSFTITQPAAILSATTASTSVSCFGGSNGSASVTVTGGTPNYTYAWAPLGGITSSIYGRPAGDYTCTITDANGCTLVKNITISTPTQLSATTSKTDVSCNGGTNGTATVTATGGVGSYTYSWSPTGGNAATATGLSQGTYTVTIQDGNTCTITASITIDQPTPLTSSITKTDVLCNGGATGTATVAPLGGNGNYTYIWSPSGGTAATATGLAIGNYSCTITDGNGCFITKSVTINQPAILSATTSQINATCTIGGQAGVTPSGGAGSYTYSWSPSGQTSAIATGLVAGNYSCLITDANGCTLTKNFNINTTNTLVATTSQTNVLCNGTNTGSASVVPSGAPGPFTYVWAPSGGNADTASNLTAGNYSVTITSVNGCSIVKTFTITEPTPLVVTPSQTNLTCNGGTNGSASVAVTGAAGSYTYSWAPSGGTAATATGLTAGTYTVTITDANLCQTTQSFTLTQPAALIATPSQTNVSCNGGSNGSATVTVTGGTGTYTYAWSPTGGTAATATGLAAGTYTVTVQDANTCQTTATVTITEPAALTATVSQVNVSCIGQSDASATVTATGGTGAYTYAWSPSGGTADTATGLSAGNYSVIITDENGCQVTKSVSILTTPDETAPTPDVANLPAITSTCSIVSAQIPVPTATDNCAGIINGTTTDPLNYTAVGSYVITWSYDDGHGNISTQNQTLNVTASPLDQVTFSNADYTFDGNLHSVQVANLPAGATVAYSVTPAASTQNGAINAGVYTVTAIVSPSASTPNCLPITLTAQLTINKAAQQITFGVIAPRIFGVVNDFNLNGISNSGLPIRYSFTYTSALPPATVSALGLVNVLRSGEVLIVAHQDGNENYLPATDVSQILVIKNNDVSIPKITLGSKVYLNPAKEIKYLMECGENNPNVSFLNETGATFTPSANFTVTTPKPGIYTQNVTVTSQDGTTTATYALTIEKPFGFYDIVHQKFNNVLLINNNPQTNGGYEFVSYQWFKNGQLVGTGQYYSAGDDLSNSLDTSADFSAKMTTKDGKVLQTCSAKITTQKSLAARLYPNPIQTGQVITVEADFPAEELENMQISLYTVSGQLIKTLKSSTVKTEVQLPDAESNMYVVVIETANIKKTLKVIVNK